jgi:hypothetical protein
MNARVWLPATGRKRSKIGPKLSCDRLAINTIAAISAEARPTALAEATCVATPQNTTPSTALPPLEIISATAFCIRRPGRARLLNPVNGLPLDGVLIGCSD